MMTRRKRRRRGRRKIDADYEEDAESYFDDFQTGRVL